ncbi:bifunctional DNA-binding transcriptional regulator/O6-methylguanine-DNA methyltransferase Ada [soil metagenome]
MERREAAADEAFVYAVRTTGIYCRPGCGSRRPLRKNVRFFALPAEAEMAGFRPCRRCRPDEAASADAHAEQIARACQALDDAGGVLTLDEAARAAGMSRYHFHRIFKKLVGITPRQYGLARRRARVHEVLNEAPTVTEAIFRVGFNASSRFYENAGLGMTPSAYRKGGADTVIRFAVGECSLGSILVAATERGVCSIQLGGDPQILVEELQRRFFRSELIGGDSAFEKLVASVVGFVEAPRCAFRLPLDIVGTAFQQRVWQALLAIPAGTTASYADIAAAIGSASAVRAVAAACAANPVAVAIPCHRVVRTNGGIGGYRWGVERKRALLRREAVA